MITIDQLLESVDLDFEPRWVTEDDNGAVWVHSSKPIILDGLWQITKPVGKARFIGYINLSEFDGKDWTDCIYEVPQKVDPYAEQRKWIGYLVEFTYLDNEIYHGILTGIGKHPDKPPFEINGQVYAEKVRLPDDNVIYKGGEE